MRYVSDFGMILNEFRFSRLIRILLSLAFGVLAAFAKEDHSSGHQDRNGSRGVEQPLYSKLTGLTIEDEMPPVNVSDWKGFTRKDFDCDGRVGTLIFPEVVASGNPWIWRPEFLGAFDTVDLALLEQGWVLAYVDIRNLYGSPIGLDAMDAFYDLVTREYDLNARVVLEGFSRGGLYAFNWAARHPERVASIYADAPVLDFKSWPGGKGKGKGSPDDWERCLKIYGLTEEEAMAYPLNPIDNLKPIADAGIPIIIVTGDSDRTVPAEENTMIAQERYLALGGRIEVIVKPGVDHHPHSLVDPIPVVEFIENESLYAVPAK